MIIYGLILQSNAQNLSPAITNNRNANNYIDYDASTVTSYLYADDDGLLVRVEYDNAGNIIVEKYDEDFKLVSASLIPVDEGFELWGGFFAGEENLYVILGSENAEETDSKEVIRIIQYDKDWNRLKYTGVFGANTFTPFDFGSLRCCEYGGMLYILTCHTMYTSSDGLNHQANMMIAVNEKDLLVTDMQCDVTYSTHGYVSHSFNQYIIADSEGNLISLNHGDMYPRAAALFKYPLKAGSEQLFGEDVLGHGISFYLCEFPMGPVYQETGAALGGLAETSKSYITAYNDDENGGKDDSVPRNIFISVTDRNNFSQSGTKIKKITDYSSGQTISACTPVLVSDGKNGGYILWASSDIAKKHSIESVITYAAFDSDGNVSQLKSAKGAVSDCAPIIWNGNVVWYVTNNSAPVFYTLNDSGISSAGVYYPFDDVSPDSWYYESVRYAYSGGLIQTDKLFYPEHNADRRTVVSALYAMDNDTEIPAMHGFNDVSASDSSAVSWASANGIVFGTDEKRFAPYDSVTREQLAAFMYRYAALKGCDILAKASLDKYSDANMISEYAFPAMQWANAAGLIMGDSETTLNPLGHTTRAELAAILMRFNAYVNA